MIQNLICFLICPLMIFGFIKPIFGKEKELPLFYWDARLRLGFSNFGDAISVAIIEKILDRSVATTTALGPRKFLAVGSIVYTE